MTTKDTASVRQKKNTASANTQSHLPISEIRDGVLLLKNGGVRIVLKTSSINFRLKSEEEQNAIILAYQGFLNSLDFPIQILIRSRKLDIDEYLINLSERSKTQENPVIQKQIIEYTEYIKKLVEYADIMEKRFYVVVPKDPSRRETVGIWRQFLDTITPEDTLEKVRQRYSEFNSLKSAVQKNADVVIAGLERCNLRVEQLGTQELIELFYQIYNPALSKDQKLHTLGEYSLLP